jgi:hypothetical protein
MVAVMAQIDHTLALAVDRISQAAGSTVLIRILRYEDSELLIRAAEQGSVEASRLMLAIAYLFARIEQGQPPAKCLVCPTVIRNPRGVLVVFCGPALDPLAEMSASAVCPACAQAPDVDARIYDALGELFGKLCPVDVHPTVGRA